MQKKINLYIFMILFLSGTAHAEIVPIQEKPIKVAKKTTEVSQDIIEESPMQELLAGAGEYAKIIGGSIFTAILYGIGNDQVTARICPEYFTEGFHKNMLQRSAHFGDRAARYMLTVKNPTVLGLYWGVVATWWFGLGLGIPITVAARVGSWPQLGIKDLIKPIGVGFASLSAMSLAAGVGGYVASKNGSLPSELINSIVWGAGDTPSEKMHAYTADSCAHRSGYEGGALVAAGLVGWILYERYKRAHAVKKKLVVS